MASKTSRIQGAIYGVAVTDALGGPVEFKFRGSFPPVTGFQYNGNFHLPPGAWTDDTSMTLCLAQSLVENTGDFILQDQISKYIQWFEHGYMSSTHEAFDLGNATRIALRIWKASFEQPGGRHVNQDGRLPGQDKIDEKLNQERSCGNGSLMRCVSIPLVYHADPARANECAALASTPTHPHSVCVDACQLYTHLIVQILLAPSQLTKEALFDFFRKYDIKTSPLVEVFAKYPSLQEMQRTSDSKIRSSGYVVDTLDAALWALFSTDTFEEGALRVVNLGDDADTVGAVYGGIAGAYYGVEAIPRQWLNGLLAKKKVDGVVQGLVELLAGSHSVKTES